MIKGEMYTNYTANEIAAQPKLWRDLYAIVYSRQCELTTFLNKALFYEDLKILLVGAGTSSYIGEVLEKYVQVKLNRTTEAVATTDLISHPHNFFNKKNQPTLIISFARSGDSPESVATMDLATANCKNWFHLIITCNPDGELTRNAKSKNSFVLLMPKEANDKGLAMTGSFTTMLLAGLLIADLKNLKESKEYVNQLEEYGRIILTKYDERIKTIARLDFKRAVFLGSGPLKGIARESQLKVQELSDGKIICKYDSFLGLRHGPKAVIDDKTIVIYLFSRDNFVNQYEYDLVRSINTQKHKMYELGIGETNKSKKEITLDLSIEVATENKIPEEYFAVCAVLPGQLLGLYKSINLGLSPDSPSINKSINRVVQGVKIYKRE